MENTLYNNTYPWNRQHPNKKAAAEKAAKQPKVRPAPPQSKSTPCLIAVGAKLATPVLSICSARSRRPIPCHFVVRMLCLQNNALSVSPPPLSAWNGWLFVSGAGGQILLALVPRSGKVCSCDEIIITIELSLLYARSGRLWLIRLGIDKINPSTFILLHSSCIIFLMGNIVRGMSRNMF